MSLLQELNAVEYSRAQLFCALIAFCWVTSHVSILILINIIRGPQPKK